MFIMFLQKSAKRKTKQKQTHTWLVYAKTKLDLVVVECYLLNFTQIRGFSLKLILTLPFLFTNPQKEVIVI